MKYTARHIRRFLDEGKIDPALWKEHFPTLLPSKVPACEECRGFMEKSCAGGKDPVACFLAKGQAASHGDLAERRKKVRDPMLGLGSRAQDLHTAKPPDQSKM